MTSDYTKVHFSFEGKKQGAELCLTLLVCVMSLDVAFAKVNMFPISLSRFIGEIWTFARLAIGFIFPKMS